MPQVARILRLLQKGPQGATGQAPSEDGVGSNGRALPPRWKVGWRKWDGNEMGHVGTRWGLGPRQAASGVFFRALAER